MESERSTRPTSSLRSVVFILLGIAAVLGAFIGLGIVKWSFVTGPVASWLYDRTDADHGRLVWLLLGLGALLMPLGFVASAATKRWRWRAAPAWLPVAGIAALLLSLLPGRGDNGSTELRIDRATEYGAGEVFVASTVACLVLVMAAFVATGLVWKGPAPRSRPGLAIVGIAYLAVWSLGAVVVIAIVGDTDGRGTWLPSVAEELERGDDGLLGTFDPGLAPSYVELIDCDTASTALLIDGEPVAELDDCRQVLAVRAVGRSGEGADRQDAGELVALLIQVYDDASVDELAATLDDAVLTSAAGLPEPPAATYSVPVTAAYSVVVAAEDAAGIPRPDDGAGARPLTRALGYLAIDTVVGLPVVPDRYEGEDDPAGATG